MSDRDFISFDLPGMTREQARSRVIRIIIQALRQVVYYAKRNDPPPLDPNRTVYVETLFEEASTRTKKSSETAGRRLGCEIMSGITFTESSLLKNETLEDTVTMLRQNLADIVVVRTKTEGVGLWLASEIRRLEVAKNWIFPGMSVVIGGEGTLHHNTQVMLDIVAIVCCQLGVRSMDQTQILEDIFFRTDAEKYLEEKIVSILDNLKLAFVGDAKYSRVAHSHVKFGRVFNIQFLFVGPKEFQPPSWWLKGVNASISDNLSDAKDWDYVYFLRTQMERLTGTPTNPGIMSVREARRLIEPLHATLEFVESCKGYIMHAQPRDSEDQIVPDSLKDHDKAIILTASAIGVPTREAIYIDCYRHQHEKGPVFEIPPFDFQMEWVLKREWWDDHHNELVGRYAGKQGIVQAIENGFALDRIESSLVMVHDQILFEDGVYSQPGGQILPGRRLDSPSMGRLKGTIWLWDYKIPPALAAKHGVISACCRLSHMDKRGEKADDQTTKGYTRVEYPLPPFIEGTFDCLNPNCITRRSKSVVPVFVVEGKKGEVGKDNWPTCGLSCIYCGYPMSVEEAVKSRYGYLIKE